MPWIPIHITEFSSEKVPEFPINTSYWAIWVENGLIALTASLLVISETRCDSIFYGENDRIIIPLQFYVTLDVGALSGSSGVLIFWSHAARVSILLCQHVIVNKIKLNTPLETWTTKKLFFIAARGNRSFHFGVFN